jgi:hypothetical protein
MVSLEFFIDIIDVLARTCNMFATGISPKAKKKETAWNAVLNGRII